MGKVIAMLKKKECILLCGEENGKKPEITITIPTYQRRKYLKTAIDSTLNQVGYSKYYEVIVVDNEVAVNGEKTETEQLMESYQDERLFYYKNICNVGMVGNWNQCVALTKGKWVAMLHDDDCIDSNYLERIDWYINKYPQGDCFIPNRKEIDGEGREITTGRWYKRNKSIFHRIEKQRVMKKREMDDRMRGHNHYGSPSAGVIFKKECAEAINGFDESVRVLADWDFFVRFREKYTIYGLNEVLASYRWAVNVGYWFRAKEPMAGIKDTLHCILLTAKSISFKSEKKRNQWIDLHKSLIYIENKDCLNEGYKELGIDKPNCVDYCRGYIFAIIRRMYIFLRIFYT